jgi:CHAD domain-containing protein
MDPEGTFGENAALMLLIRFAEMYRLAGAVDDPERVQELHDMRIAAKRLRYTMEIFQPCYGGELAKEYKSVYEKIKSIQEQIGDIHDCDVRGPAVTEFVEEHAKRRPEIRVGLIRLIDKEKQDRDRMYSEFIEYWANLTRKNLRGRFLRLIASLDIPAQSVAEEETGSES